MDIFDGQISPWNFNNLYEKHERGNYVPVLEQEVVESDSNIMILNHL